jgi:anti-sigma factor RsiW
MTEHRPTGESPMATPEAPLLDCTTALRLLWDFLDGRLGPVDEGAVRRHLARCRHCHPSAAFGEIVLGAVSSQRQPVADELPLRARVLAALRAEGFASPDAPPG